MRGELFTRHGNALPLGTYLDEFELRTVAGEGGFSIVYRAWDHSLKRQVAVKEYFPSGMVGRSGGTQVVVRSERHVDAFEAGLASGYWGVTLLLQGQAALAVDKLRRAVELSEHKEGPRWIRRLPTFRPKVAPQRCFSIARLRMRALRLQRLCRREKVLRPCCLACACF